MDFLTWKVKHRLTHAEAGDMLGVTHKSIAGAYLRGESSRHWDNFARLAENTPPQLRLSVEGGSYGMPVAYFGDDPRAYAPSDVIRGDGRIAGHVVLLWASLRLERTEEEYQMARRYLSQWADGPQLR